MLLTHLRLCRLIYLPDFITPICHPDDSSLTHAGSSCAQFSVRLLTLTQLDAISDLYFYELYACLYLYLSDSYIYWVGDGMIPIFNLLCNHPSVVT